MEKNERKNNLEFSFIKTKQNQKIKQNIVFLLLAVLNTVNCKLNTKNDASSIFIANRKIFLNAERNFQQIHKMVGIKKFNF